MSTHTTKVFKTNENTILIVTAKTEGCNNRQYVSVTANEIEPILRSEAVNRVREGLEDGELWKMAVESDNTTLGLDEWVDYVISTYGELSGFDNSLYDNDMTIDGEDYIFDSRSCGCLHEAIKEVTSEFNELIDLHLKDGKTAITKAEKIIMRMNKTEDSDIHFWVEKYTREILGIEV